MANHCHKLDPERSTAILRDIAAGLTRACAAERSGVSDRTLRRWVSRGSRSKPTRYDKEFVSFVSALKKAERDAEARNVAIILQAAKGGAVIQRTTVTKTIQKGETTTTTTTVTERYTSPEWCAAAWWCERKFPDAWSKDAELLQDLKTEKNRERKAAKR